LLCIISTGYNRLSAAIPESCFQIRNFPINIESTTIKYRIVAEVFKGGRKFSRVRLVAKNKDSPTHTTEQIIPVGNGLKPNKIIPLFAKY
jgi:hypothetical protein